MQKSFIARAAEFEKVDKLADKAWHRILRRLIFWKKNHLLGGSFHRLEFILDGVCRRYIRVKHDSGIYYGGPCAEAASGNRASQVKN